MSRTRPAGFGQGRAPLRDVGVDPDYRFTLANERTFLAWIRTALALMAGGVAVSQFLPSSGLAGARHVIGLTLVALGGVLAAGSYRHWESNERAMRMGHGLPTSVLPRLLTASLALVVLAVLGVLLLESRR
ncbi:MAG: DUF202 domain-containing protein [Dermatophilaceae bacterium]